MTETQQTRKSASVHWQKGKLSIGADRSGHALIVDASKERDGNGWGFQGGNLMLLAIGGCLTTVLLEAAASRGIPVEDLNIDVSARDAHHPFRYVDFEIAVKIVSPAKDQELEKLVKIAERGCQVSNTIRGGAEFALTLEHIATRGAQ